MSITNRHREVDGALTALREFRSSMSREEWDQFGYADEMTGWMAAACPAGMLKFVEYARARHARRMSELAALSGDDSGSDAGVVQP